MSFSFGLFHGRLLVSTELLITPTHYNLGDQDQGKNFSGELYYPPAVAEKARRLEQLLLRLEAGEPLDQVRAELELELKPERVRQLKAKYEAGGRRWEALLDGRFDHYQHVNSAVRAYLFDRKQQDDHLTAGELASEVVQKFKVRLSVGHINHMLGEVALTRPPGRPHKRAVPVARLSHKKPYTK